MKKHRALKALLIVLAIPAFLLLAGFSVMWLWNWLMPAIFGLVAINFWQALGLLALSKILFGGWKGGGHRHHRGGGPWAGRFRRKWENMSEAEREKFLRCRGRFGMPDVPETEMK